MKKEAKEEEEGTFKEENEDLDMATKRGCHRVGKGAPQKKGGHCGKRLKRRKTSVVYTQVGTVRIKLPKPKRKIKKRKFWDNFFG